MTKRKTFTTRLSPSNYLYLCELARQHDTTLNQELNRIVRELRDEEEYAHLSGVNHNSTTICTE